MGETWTMQLDRLEVINADEDGILSDGDEPYMMAIGFRSKPLTPGSTSAWWSGALDDGWASGIDGGEGANIPASMGSVLFDNVERLSTDAVLAGRLLPEVLGTLFIIMESDATPFDAVRDKTNEIRGVIEDKLRDLIENGNIDLDDPAGSIRRAIEDAKAQLQPTVLEALGLWLRSFTDPDDVMGTSTMIFAAADASLGAVLPLPVLNEQGIDFEVAANGARYQLKGRVARQGWRGFELAPPGSASPTGSITSVSRIPGSLEVWWIAPNGSVQGAYWYEGAKQWQPYDLAPAGSASPTGSITSVSRIPGSMEVFWIGAKGSVQDHYWYEGATWQGFELSPAGSASASGGIVAVSRIPGSMEVWYPGPNGSVQDRYWHEG
jgi:hypothetical protein